MVSNLLDAIPCLSSGQRGCKNAESVGHGITTSGDFVHFDSIGSSGMKTWTKGDFVLNYINNSFTIKKDILNTEIGGKAINGLFYTKRVGELAHTYEILEEFGVPYTSNTRCDYVNKNMNSTNVCAVRGMRLPKLNEVKSSGLDYSCRPSVVDGIPYTFDYALTSSFSEERVLVYRSDYVSGYLLSNRTKGYIRCVR